MNTASATHGEYNTHFTNNKNHTIFRTWIFRELVSDWKKILSWTLLIWNIFKLSANEEVLRIKNRVTHIINKYIKKQRSLSRSLWNSWLHNYKKKKKKVPEI
jgi:hypothetical protein